MKQIAISGPHSRRALSVGLLAAMLSVQGCISYSLQDSRSESEVLADGDRTRSVVVDRVRGSSLVVSATESWQRELRSTTTNEYEFEVDTTLSLIGEASEMVVLSPLLLAIDVVALVITGPFATIDALVSGDEVRDYTQNMNEPVAGMAATVTSGAWQADGETDEKGRIEFELREPAAQALCAGSAMNYQVRVAGEPPVDGALTVPQTMACASMPDSEEPARRFAYWRGLVAKSAPGDVRDLLAKQADRVSPTTLANYKSQQKLPATMSMLHVDHYRTHAEQHAAAEAGEDRAAQSVALGLMAGLVAPHDKQRAHDLKLQSLDQSAAYVADYYEDRSLRSTPSFMVNYCAHYLKEAQACRDDRSAAIFSSVLAARAGDLGRLLHQDLGRSDRIVARMHEGTREEVKRQADMAAYAAEVERMKQEEEAWHYRYLNGRGGGAPRGSASIRGTSSLANRSSRGPSISEQASAHRAWLQTQKHNATNRNRAFDQFDRRD